jgi:hypothetical protein
MITETQRQALTGIVARLGLQKIFTDLDFLGNRLEAFSAEYLKDAKRAPAGAIPSTMSVDEIVRENESNPDRLGALFQAMAFLCTPGFLSMIWMIEMGAEILEAKLSYSLRESVEIDVKLGFGAEHAETVDYHSAELWDLAFFRLVGLSKSNDEPLLSGVYPLRLRQ